MELNIKLGLEQINTILVALAKQPFEAVADLISIIRNQAQEQINSTNAVVEKEHELQKKK